MSSKRRCLGRPPLLREWGLATLEIVLAILASAETGDRSSCRHQSESYVHRETRLGEFASRAKAIGQLEP